MKLLEMYLLQPLEKLLLIMVLGMMVGLECMLKKKTVLGVHLQVQMIIERLLLKLQVIPNILTQ